jgi:ElaB/YqjD/DUF883 family membrane-anchored ribosome-binding protein
MSSREKPMENGGSGVGAQTRRDAERLADEIQDRLEGVRGYAEDAGEWVRAFARERPIAAVALAAGIGFFVGRMLSRT